MLFNLSRLESSTTKVEDSEPHTPKYGSTRRKLPQFFEEQAGAWIFR